METDITHCNGIGCALRTRCQRFDHNQHHQMDACDENTREGYLPLKAK